MGASLFVLGLKLGSRGGLRLLCHPSHFLGKSPSPTTSPYKAAPPPILLN